MKVAKFIFVFTIISMMLTLNVFAQNNLDFGLHFGANYSSPNLDDEITEGIVFHSALSPSLGIAIAYKLNNHLRVNSGLELDYLGWGYSPVTKDFKSTGRFRTIEIPIGLSTHSHSYFYNDWLLTFSGGVALSFPARGFCSGKSENSLTNVIIIDKENYLGGINYLATVGLGFEKVISEAIRINIGMNYHKGMKKIVEGEIKYLSGDAVNNTYAYKSLGGYLSFDVIFFFTSSK